MARNNTYLQDTRYLRPWWDREHRDEDDVDVEFAEDDEGAFPLLVDGELVALRQLRDGKQLDDPSMIFVLWARRLACGEPDRLQITDEGRRVLELAESALRKAGVESLTEVELPPRRDK